MKNAVRRKGSALLLAVVMFANAVPITTLATTTQQKIDQEQQEKDELEGKLDETNDNLQDLKGEHNSLRGKLDQLNKQLTDIRDNLEELERQIEDKEQEIADTQAELENARQLEAQQYENMKMQIQFMYENNAGAYLDALFHAESFSEFLNISDYFEQISAYNQKMLEEYEANRQYIEEEEARLQAEKVELDSLKADAEKEKEKVSGLISQTADAITEYADQISEAEQRALEYEEEIRKKEENLDYLREKLAQEIAMSQAAANATWRDISEVTFAESDRYLLANLIYCEAGGESYDGKLAVGAVVVNRVLSSVYPDTIMGVIYQKSQFSPVASGRLELALTANKATADCYRAADEAMSGVTNVGNCVYFRTPVEGLTGISIGGHIFY